MNHQQLAQDMWSAYSNHDHDNTLYSGDPKLPWDKIGEHRQRCWVAVANVSLDASIDLIASVAHNVNRAYCQRTGDDSQPTWHNAPVWQQDSARNGVRMHLANPNATAEDSHISWLAQKVAEGWVYGPEKNPETKQHPCIMPYGELPASQQIKDSLFKAVIDSLRHLATVGGGA